MFKYPQGEGGHEGRYECEPAAVRRYVLPCCLRLTPLLSRFVTRSVYPQTYACMGGNGHGC